MKLDRRQLLAAGGLFVTSCRARSFAVEPGLGPEPMDRLDRLLRAHADRLPERAGAGANHYPMAAETLVAWGHAAAIDDAWSAAAERYAGPLGRSRAIVGVDDAVAALGDYERFGDWLDHFRRALQREPWRAVVRRWAPRLAPALCAAAFHGVIRTGHAVRALGRRDTAARRGELAAGLAYWAARYVELPTIASTPQPDPRPLATVLASLSSPWIDDRSDVPFDAVVARLTERPLAPAVELDEPSDASPRTALNEVVNAAATGFLAMLVARRNRIWLLHTITGPAALDWLLPEVDANGARSLVAHARQAVIATYAAYGEPFVPGAHERTTLAPWPELVRRAVASRSVHGLELVDALLRHRHVDDRRMRSVAEQFFEWT